jgi:electron transfer flavoprotein beta subunit
MLAALWVGPQGTFASEVERRWRHVKSDPRSRWRTTDGQAENARGRHHRSASERAALCLSAQHHEGQEKPLDEKTPADYGVDTAPRLEIVKTVEPPAREAGVKVGSVGELLDKLKTEAGVI